MKLNTAVQAPMPMASVRITIAENPGSSLNRPNRVTEIGGETGDQRPSLVCALSAGACAIRNGVGKRSHARQFAFDRRLGVLVVETCGHRGAIKIAEVFGDLLDGVACAEGTTPSAAVAIRSRTASRPKSRHGGARRPW